MKHIIFISLATLAVSCGNPHISSSRGGLERTNPPIISTQEDPTCGTGIVVDDIKFLMGEESTFKAMTKCRSKVEEDFNTFNPGLTDSVSNDERESHSYEIRHHIETIATHSKVDTLDEIYGPEVFELEIQRPVTNDGPVGIDTGLNSLNVNDMSKDALVWNFDVPVSSFGVKVVNFGANESNPGLIRVYDCDGFVLHSAKAYSPYSFLGFVSARPDVCYVSVTAPDNFRAVAVDGFVYGK